MRFSVPVRLLAAFQAYFSEAHSTEAAIFGSVSEEADGAEATAYFYNYIFTF